MTKSDLITHLDTYASATIYIDSTHYTDFPSLITEMQVDRAYFINSLVALPDSFNLNVTIDTNNDVKLG